jgi:hypothetical protein
MTAPNDVVDPDGLLGDPTEAPEDVPAETPEPDAAAELGDAGKKALDAMKAKWKAAEKRARDAEAAVEAAKKPEPKEGQPDVDAIRAEARKEAAEKANQRILRSEIKAAATGKMANPALALRLLDLTEFEVDDDGNVDSDDINDALAKLIEENPGLGVTQGEPKRFKGSGDGGSKGSAGKPQLTEADVKRLSKEGKHAEIEQARQDGRLNVLLGIEK